MSRAGNVDQAQLKASTLVEALPYIRSYRNRTVVVKIGGDALNDPALAAQVGEDLALMALVGIKLVVVHGGGPQVTEALAAEGIESNFVEGLRVTSADAIEVVRRVLVGSINGDLVARLCGAGLSAIGLWGGDGGLLSATTRSGPDGQDLGRVGAVESVNSAFLASLLAEGHTPVLASVGVDHLGPVNINADEVAGAVAAALEASKLVYLTNVEGLYRDFGDQGSLVSELKLAELELLIGELSAGMQPKAVSVAVALTAGVGKAHILDGRVPHALLLEVFTDEGIGTQVLP